MNSVSKICDTIERKNIAEAVGVNLTAVSNAAVSGTFPASWFDAVEKLCISKEIQCPRNLFNFKGSPNA
jgi:hypothetical protein